MTEDDTLAPLASERKNPSSYQKTKSDFSYLKTYTAGEDGSRLAEMAKQFGLENQRNPRKQVRDESKKKGHDRDYADIFGEAGQQVLHMIQDSSVEVARMRAVYTLGYPPRAESFSEYDVLQAPQVGHKRHGSDMPTWLEKIEHEEKDLHAHGVGGDLTSAVLGIIKGMVGPAILYLPHGLANTGWALALPMLACTTSMFLYSSRCLLDTWRLEHDKMQQRIEKRLSLDTHPTPEATGEGQPLINDVQRFKMTFLSYPELAYRALGEKGERCIKVGIGLMQSGVCLTYLIFVPQNLSTALRRLVGISIRPEWFLLVMVGIQVPLSWIRDIRKLTLTNFLANALILYGLITCLVLSLRQATAQEADDVPPQIPGVPESSFSLIFDRLTHLAPFAKGWFLFIGTSVLLFEGSITLLVPLQEAVISEEDRKKFPRVYQNTILSIICFYILFSVTCWMSLGSDVRTVLTTSLPDGNAATSVQLAYSIAVMFTYPLQNFPALEIACRSIANSLETLPCCAPNNFWTQRNVISFFLIIGMAFIAVTTMESLDKVVSLMGGLLGCPIAFVFPPLIHHQLMSKAGTLTPTRKFLDFLVSFLGLVATVLATVTTIITWK